MYREIEGNLITLAQQGNFDVITHGCNCFCNMKSGIAPQMDKAFGCGTFPMELRVAVGYDVDGEEFTYDTNNVGNINKLGQIDYQNVMIYKGRKVIASTSNKEVIRFVVANSYTQYTPSVELKPLDYEATTLCMRKINHIFKGQRIGLPRIGAGLAGGDWERIKAIIITELKDCDVTVVIYKP